MSVKLLTEHHLEFLSFKGGCTGSYVSTLVKIPHCWKSHVTAQIQILAFTSVLQYILARKCLTLCTRSSMDVSIKFDTFKSGWSIIYFDGTGPRSAVGNVSGYRCVSDCRSRGREFDSGPIPYFRGDWSWNNFYGHSPPFHWFIQEGLLSVTSESMCTNYWLTAQEKVWLSELTVPQWP